MKFDKVSSIENPCKNKIARIIDFCDPAGTRTQGPNIKSVVLYQLSYEINHPFFGSAKIEESSL